MRDLIGRFMPAAMRMPLVARRASEAEGIIRELFELAGIAIGGTGPGDIRVHDERFYERVLRDASIGLGEAYMDDWWEVDQLDVMIEKVMRANLKQKVKGSWHLRALTVKAILFNLQSKARSGGSVEAHYDIGNDLYTRMLDERMVYTCGYWAGIDYAPGEQAKHLTRAQEAKIDLVCRKLGLEPGMRVLDLGCGWGGLASWAAEKYGCTVHGVTLSKDQVSLGNELWKHLPVKLELKDYRDVRGLYDRVVSVGMMEHVGPKNHRAVFEVIDRCMVDDGIAVIHTIANNRSLRHGTAFIEKYVFPNAVAPSMAQLGRAMEGLFIPEDMQNIGPDYDPTLMAWWDNFDRTYGEIRHRYDRRFYQMWKLYLLGAAGASRARDAQLYQIQLTKTGRAQPTWQR